MLEAQQKRRAVVTYPLEAAAWLDKIWAEEGENFNTQPREHCNGSKYESTLNYEGCYAMCSAEGLYRAIFK